MIFIAGRTPHRFVARPIIRSYDARDRTKSDGRGLEIAQFVLCLGDSCAGVATAGLRSARRAVGGPSDGTPIDPDPGRPLIGRPEWSDVRKESRNTGLANRI